MSRQLRKELKAASIEQTYIYDINTFRQKVFGCKVVQRKVKKEQSLAWTDEVKSALRKVQGSLSPKKSQLVQTALIELLVIRLGLN